MPRTAAELKATRLGAILLLDPLPFLGARLFFPDEGFAGFKCLCLAAARPFSAIIGSLRCAFRSRPSILDADKLRQVIEVFVSRVQGQIMLQNQQLLTTPPPTPSGGATLSDAVIAERRDGR
jgi:hypothetical protein